MIRAVTAGLHHHGDAYFSNMTTVRQGFLRSALSVILLLLLVLGCEAKISNKRLCYDEKCSVVVSMGRTMVPYHSKDKDILGFPANVEVKIFSKEAGNRIDLWGIEVLGKRGFAPKQFIKEHKVLHSKANLKYEVSTEESNETKKAEDLSKIDVDETKQEDQIVVDATANPLVPDILNSIAPHQVSPSYESVYDGTLLPNENDASEPLTPSYSTQILQEPVKTDEQVRLNVYPNIISSTFDALTGILSSGKDASTEESLEVNSSETFVSEEVTEKTPAIEEVTEKTPAIEEDKTESQETYSSQEQSVSNEMVKEIPEIQEQIEENLIADSLENAESEETPEIEKSEEEKLNTELIDKITSEDTTEKTPVTEKADESNLSSEEKVVITENVTFKNTSKEITIDEFVQPNVVENNTDSEPTFSSIETEATKPIDMTEINASEEMNQQEVSSEENVTQAEEPVTPQPMENSSQLFPPQDVSSTNNLSQINAPEILQPIVTDDLQSDIVPKQEEALSDSSTSNSSNITDASEATANVEQTNINKQEAEETNDSSASKVDDFVPPEVPSIQQEPVPSVDQSFLPIVQTDIVQEIIENTTAPDVTNVGGVPVYHNDSEIDSSKEAVDSSHEQVVDIPSTPSFGEFLGNRNLLNAGKGFQYDDYSEEIGVDKVVYEEDIQTTTSSGSEEFTTKEEEVTQKEEPVILEDVPPANNIEKIVLPLETCDKTYGCSTDHAKSHYSAEENAVTYATKVADSSETLLYVCITAVTTLLFSLGYYFLENRRRDAYLIGKINNLEKDLMITRKECIMLDESFKSTKTKLDSIEDESFGSNEMVLSLKDELVASENARLELVDQIASLEKELESTSEAGLELERMLREILSTQNEENNPLAQSIEDLQVRLNDQQVANESLTNALAAKVQENETLTGDLTVSIKKVEELQAELVKFTEELEIQTSTKVQLEQTLSDQINRLEIENRTATDEKYHLRKEFKLKELEVKELMGVIENFNSNNLDFDRLYQVSQVKAEAAHLQEENEELKSKLSEVEGAHQLLEEHVKVTTEEVDFLSEQCKSTEKEKKDAETRLEVLTKFFEDKETQRQKEEAVWLEKQGEVSSTVERIQTMQSEILNYKQQIEMLRREILDQEREYKNQISLLETKSHEQWLAARQNERRLEEVKAESSQLRNRLTLAEKNINDGDPENKLHRAANGETVGNAHALFVGGETSSSPLMFAAGGSSSTNLPPLPPPSYLYGLPGSFPPPPPPGSFLPPPPPPPELAGSRPPPLGGGRLSSPPPPGGVSASSPPLSPPPPLPSHMQYIHARMLAERHRSPPPLHPFASDGPFMSRLPPPHFAHQAQSQQHTAGNAHNNLAWPPEELPPPSRNSSAAFQRAKNHKGSLHSSGESLDKSHHGGKA